MRRRRLRCRSSTRRRTAQSSRRRPVDVRPEPERRLVPDQVRAEPVGGSPPGLATTTSSSTCGASDSRHGPGSGSPGVRSRPRRRSHELPVDGKGSAGGLGPGEPRRAGEPAARASLSASARSIPPASSTGFAPLTRIAASPAASGSAPAVVVTTGVPEAIASRPGARTPRSAKGRRGSGSAVEAGELSRRRGRGTGRARPGPRAPRRARRRPGLLVRPDEDETRRAVASSATASIAATGLCAPGGR